MADPAQTAELSGWFVRRKAGASDAKQQEVQDQQKGKRGRCKEPQEPAPAEQPKKPSLPAAAAAAVAAVVHPERRHKAEGADAGETKRQQHQQPAKPPSGSDSDSDAGQGGRRPGHRRHSHDEPHTEGEQVGEERQAAAAQQQAQQQQQQQAQQQREEEEVDDRPRVLAYSDSDSDVESHFKRFERDVTHHLLPPSEEEAAAQAAAAEAAAAAAKAAEEAAAAAARRSPLRRLGGAAAGAAGAAAQHVTPGMALRAGGLLALHRLHPGAARAASLISAAAPLAGVAASRAGLPLGSLPQPLQAAGRELGRLGQAALAIAAGRLLLAALHQHRQRQRQRRGQQGAAAAQPAGAVADGAPVAVGQPVATPGGRLLRRKSSVNLSALVGGGDLSTAIRLLNPQTAAEWAAVYAAEMREMRRMLEECEVELPADRFDATNAELLRFAKACGLLTAKTPEARAAAVEAGFSRVVHTVEWTGRQRFMSERRLRRWDRLVAWKAHDACGRPILLARVGRAQQLVRPERYEEFVHALISLVYRGLTTQFSEGPGGAEQMVVVLDCRGGSSIGMTRHMGLLKRFAVTMTQHFPDRLFRLHLLELPLLLRWALHGVTPLLHPATRSKLVASSISDPPLPVTVAFLTKRRSSGKQLKRSLSNASFPSSGDSTPALLSPQPSHLAPPAVAAAVAAAAPGSPVVGQRQPLHQRQPEKDEEVPHTPPPTLKAPASPHELASQRVARRLSHERVALHARAHQRAHPAHGEAPQQGEGKQHQGAYGHRQVALHARTHLHHPSQPLAHLQRQPRSPAAAAAGEQQEVPPSPFAQRAAQERAASWGPFDAAAALPPAQGDQQQPAAAAPPAAGAASGKAAAAASAAAGPTSHAVPWSPGMQSPAGDLSRDSSFGEELVPAARAKAAADAVRQVDLTAAAAATASPALAAHRPPPLRHVGSDGSDALTLTPTPRLTPGPQRAAIAAAGADGGAPAGLAGVWAMFAALLPTLRSPVGGGEDQPDGQPELRRRRSLLAHRIPSFTSSREPSPVTPYSARRRGGLGDLPERPHRHTPGRGVTPRKSSLRRTASADSMEGARQPLGSHPLRRQSSVSWAEELESIKEIQPHAEGSPDGTARWLHAVAADSQLRTRLAAAAAAAGQQPPAVVLAACLLALMMVAVVERMLLSSLL